MRWAVVLASNLAFSWSEGGKLFFTGVGIDSGPPLTNEEEKVTFQDMMEECMKLAVLWVVAPSSLVKVYRRFVGTFCLHLQEVSSP
jgi:hypothetical protein